MHICIMALSLLHIKVCDLNTLYGICVTVDIHFWQIYTSACAFLQFVGLNDTTISGAAVAARASANPRPPRSTSPPSRPTRRAMDSAAGAGRRRVRIAIVGDVVSSLSLSLSEHHSLPWWTGTPAMRAGAAFCDSMLGYRVRVFWQGV